MCWEIFAIRSDNNGTAEFSVLNHFGPETFLTEHLRDVDFLDPVVEGCTFWHWAQGPLAAQPAFVNLCEADGEDEASFMSACHARSTLVPSIGTDTGARDLRKPTSTTSQLSSLSPQSLPDMSLHFATAANSLIMGLRRSESPLASHAKTRDHVKRPRPALRDVICQRFLRQATSNVVLSRLNNVLIQPIVRLVVLYRLPEHGSSVGTNCHSWHSRTLDVAATACVLRHGIVPLEVHHSGECDFHSWREGLDCLRVQHEVEVIQILDDVAQADGALGLDAFTAGEDFGFRGRRVVSLLQLEPAFFVHGFPSVHVSMGSARIDVDFAVSNEIVCCCDFGGFNEASELL